MTDDEDAVDDGSGTSNVDSAVDTADDAAGAVLTALGLKSETRTGWADRGIERPESVAAHSWGVATLALALADDWEAGTGESLDRERVLSLALVHDLGEAIAGDVPRTADEETRRAATRAERAAIERFDAGLDASVDALHREFAAGETPEARFVRELDALEMLAQAVRYERDRDTALGEFFRSADDRIDSDPGRAWLARLRAARPTDVDEGSGDPNAGEASGDFEADEAAGAGDTSHAADANDGDRAGEGGDERGERR